MLTFAVLSLVALASGANGAPFALSITGPRASVKSGAEIRVHVTLTNTSDREITIFDTNRDCDYQAEVVDEAGQPAIETEYRRTLKCEGPSVISRNVLITLKPGETREDELVISDLYDMRRPGHYAVHVSRKIPKDLGQGTARSNGITIVVEA